MLDFGNDGNMRFDRGLFEFFVGGIPHHNARVGAEALALTALAHTRDREQLRIIGESLCAILAGESPSRLKRHEVDTVAGRYNEVVEIVLDMGQGEVVEIALGSEQPITELVSY